MRWVVLVVAIVVLSIISTSRVSERFGVTEMQALTITALCPLGVWILVKLLGLDGGSRKRRKLLGLNLEDLDRLSGEAFEEWIEAVLLDAGWQVTRTMRGGDFGVDLIANRGEVVVAVEAKRRDRPLGNAVVRSVLGGAASYGCPYAAVVTQSRFTQAAERQASCVVPPVLLIAREDLSELAERLRIHVEAHTVDADAE
jgi:HJR/Mrr/RecB family endonuclease